AGHRFRIVADGELRSFVGSCDERFVETGPHRQRGPYRLSVEGDIQNAFVSLCRAGYVEDSVGGKHSYSVFGFEGLVELADHSGLAAHVDGESFDGFAKFAQPLEPGRVVLLIGPPARNIETEPEFT